jgi:uncharacterized Zn finger protein (UPF0148 family)
MNNPNNKCGGCGVPKLVNINGGRDWCPKCEPRPDNWPTVEEITIQNCIDLNDRCQCGLPKLINPFGGENWCPACDSRPSNWPAPPAEEPAKVEVEMSPREQKFEQLVKDTGLEFTDMAEWPYLGSRFIVICQAGDSEGTFSEANTTDEVAGIIGDYLGLSYSFGAWYDLEEPGLPAHGCEWRIRVRGSRNDGLIMTGIAEGEISVG